ncbi:transposable element Tcb1 transposase [Trichonephila clavipes]|uniref:Transposable element Tcb1 transposase n=1 Tax=Trichonephila clavipes TaxID=2585209 RepID=A0A8X6R9J6_TRICX|nr:transposable element Tcb1 transposase [Trichonephila clavipes]
MTAQRYVHSILQPHVLPLMQRLPGAIFRQDNALPHTARVSQDCLLTVTPLPCSGRSPDLSTIKHIWDRLGWRVRHPTSLNELEARLQQIWNEMSQDIIQNLYALMPDRIASYIRVRGVQQDHDYAPMAPGHHSWGLVWISLELRKFIRGFSRLLCVMLVQEPARNINHGYHWKEGAMGHTGTPMSGPERARRFRERRKADAARNFTAAANLASTSNTGIPVLVDVTNEQTAATISL